MFVQQQPQQVVMGGGGTAVVTGSYPSNFYGSDKNKARIAAYIDIGLGLIELILLGFVAFAVISSDDSESLKSKSASVLVITFVVTVQIVLVITQLFIASGLVTATTRMTPAAVAIQKAKCYRCFNTFLVVISWLNIILNFAEGSAFLLISILSATCRIIFILIVHRFIQRLEILLMGTPVITGGVSTLMQTTPTVQMTTVMQTTPTVQTTTVMQTAPTVQTTTLMQTAPTVQQTTLQHVNLVPSNVQQWV